MIQSNKITAPILWCVCICLLIDANVIVASDYYELDTHRAKIDSLLEELPESSGASQYKILSDLSEIYLSVSMDSSREYALLALENARKRQDSNEMAYAYKLLGNIALYKGQYIQVVNFYDSSLSIYKTLNDSNGQSKVWNNLGIVYHNIGSFQTSIDYHLKSLYAKMQLNDSFGLANSYNNIGSIYFEIKDFDKAYAYYQQALEISQKLGVENTIQSVLNNMGLISQELGQQQQALDYFNKAVNSAKQNENYNLMAEAYHNIGKSLMELGKYNESLVNYNKSLELAEKLGIENSATLNNIGQVYIELDYYVEAIKYLDKALKIAKKNNQFLVLSQIYNNRAVAYQRLKKYKEAFYDFSEFKKYDDSLKIQTFSNQVSEISNKHELEKSKQEVEKNRLLIENQKAKLYRRNLLVYLGGGAAIALLLLVLILLWLMRQRGSLNEALKSQNNEVLRSQKIIKKINIALTEKEEKLRSIFDVSPYALFVLEANNTIIDCNDSALSLLHAKKKRDLIDKPVTKFLADSQSRTDLIQHLENNQLSDLPFCITRLDDSTFESSITGRTILNNQSEVFARVIVVIDITERLQFIDNLKEAKIKAEESDRLKTAFLANMSHEIRTPMNAIVGFSNLLNEPDMEADRKQEFLKHILDSSSLLLNLIDDIIDISKIEAGQLKFHKQKFKVNDVIRTVFDSFHGTNMNPDLEFRLSLPEDSENIQCNSDPVRLRQVLSNLLSNANKFTNKGFISLSYKIKDMNQPQRLEFCVEDTGIGIPDEMHELVFDRFRQVDDSQSRKYGGTGLGLAISKKLVEMAGGSIRLESEHGKGSAFYFTLPFVISDVKNNQIVESASSIKYQWKKKTLLIAEDENSNFELLKAILKETKIKILWAHNGNDSVDIIREQKPVDLILMDIRMPRMNGYEATREIKKIRPDLPIISTTAYAMAEDENKSKKAGCDDYISKPIRSETLLPLMNKYLSVHSPEE